jgi:hypothetical protein
MKAQGIVLLLVRDRALMRALVAALVVAVPSFPEANTPLRSKGAFVVCPFLPFVWRRIANSPRIRRRKTRQACDGTGARRLCTGAAMLPERVESVALRLAITLSASGRARQQPPMDCAWMALEDDAKGGRPPVGPSLASHVRVDHSIASPPCGISR